MTSINLVDMYNSNKSDTINSITEDAVAVMKTMTGEIVFMKEYYQYDGCDDMGPYHHIWDFYVFVRDSNGLINHLRFNREYNEKAGDKSSDFPYEADSFTDYDVGFIARKLQEQHYDESGYGYEMDYAEEEPPEEPIPEEELFDELGQFMDNQCPMNRNSHR